MGRRFESYSGSHFWLAYCKPYPWGDWGIAKLVKARDFDSRIVGSSPATPAIFGSLAQLAEHLTFNQGVPGSNPG